MTSLEIDAFLAIYREGSVTKAAEALYIIQSSLSTRLRTLERELGCTLFDRNKGSRALTLTADHEVYSFWSQELQQWHKSTFGANAEPQVRVCKTNFAIPDRLLYILCRRAARNTKPFVCFLDSLKEVMQKKKISGPPTKLFFRCAVPSMQLPGYINDNKTRHPSLGAPCGSLFDLFLKALVLCKLACCLSSFITVRRCQPETQSAFFDFKGEPAIFILIGSANTNS